MSTATHTDTALENGELQRPPRPEIEQSIEQATRDWSRWQRDAAERKKRPALHKLLAPHAVCWGLSSQEVAAAELTLRLAESHKRPRGAEPGELDWEQLAQKWNDSLDAGPLNRERALECVAWSRALSHVAAIVPEDVWRSLAATLVETSYGADAAEATEAEDALTTLLLTGELSLSLAYHFPKLACCSARREPGRRAIAEALDQLLDGEGMPQARYLPALQPLLASFTRCLTMDREIKKGRVEKSARLQFDWMVRQTIRWSRPDGSRILDETTEDSPYFDEMLQAALAITGDKSDALAYAVHRGRRKATASTLAELPEPAEHSEWSEVAVLRTDWSADQCSLGVNYHAGRLDVELSSRGNVLLAGSSVPTVAIDGKTLGNPTDWEEVCWESDDDMDYLELETRLSDEWRVQRHMLLARKDRFLFVADAVLGARPASIAYEHRLPCAAGVGMEQADETYETFLKAPKRCGVVLPLGLPEWKTDPRRGRFDAAPAALIQNGAGSALFAPLFIDLDRDRLRKPLTWRQLTVGEDLQVVSPDAAVAYRVHIGKRQWVFYRSLGPAGNRTFLGINLTSDFFAARFNVDGQYEQLVEVVG